MNYYELLEVSPKASPAVIRAAYKSLMQRYHPDKNRDDPSIAEMATLVVQAFEVLSDETKRAAYDEKLRQDGRKRTHRATSRTPRGDRTKVGFALLLAVALLVFSNRFFEARLQATLPAVADKAAPFPIDRSSRHVARLVTDLTVTLLDPNTSAKDHDRVLFIPSFGVRVGTQDPENAILHLRNMAGPIRDGLQEDLAKASFGELIKPDGEQYLAGLILQSIRRVSGTQAPASTSDAVEDHYGAMEITLPGSFAIR